MSGNNGAHPELGEKEPLTMKEAKTYRSTIANPGPAYVFTPTYHMTHSNTLLVVAYSPSQLPHSCYLSSTSIHVEFGRQILWLVWPFSRVVSCNSLQACGSSREATYLELQVTNVYHGSFLPATLSCLFRAYFMHHIRQRKAFPDFDFLTS